MTLIWAFTATFLLAMACVVVWCVIWVGRATRDDLRKARAKLAKERRKVANLRVRLETYRDDETWDLLNRALGDNDTGEC